MWFILGLTTAFLHGTSSAVSKKLLLSTDDRVVAWGVLFFALPWLFVGFLAGGRLPVLPLEFWGLVALMVPLELTAYLSSLRAIQSAPLSLTIPFLALTPLFTIVTGWLVLGEQITPAGFLGVLTVVGGAYVLQAELVPQGVLAPVKAMFRKRGIRLMLVTATLYSLTSTLGKRAIAISGPLTFPFIYFTVDTLALTALALQGARPAGGLVRAIRPRLPLFLLIGMLTGLTFMAHCAGVLLAPVAYFISVKRLGLLVSVLYGGLLFREEALLQRLLGCGLMVAGVALIYLWA